jgi:hypothetical protein
MGIEQVLSTDQEASSQMSGYMKRGRLIERGLLTRSVDILIVYPTLSVLCEFCLN